MKYRASGGTQFLGNPFDRQGLGSKIGQKSSSINSQSWMTRLRNDGEFATGRLFSVDYDVFEIHNINRQLIFTLQEVGKLKAQAFLNNSWFNNAEHLNLDIAQECFNESQDYYRLRKKINLVIQLYRLGRKIDSAICQLCLALSIPLVGRTLATSLIVNFSSRTVYPDISVQMTLIQIIPILNKSRIRKIQNLSFLAKNNNYIGRSNVLMSTQFMVSHQIN